ncbi:MAG TPA: hypothetical protein GXX25_05280, partial [Desulfotomaculum sp.]|nr:hypothetical protein [Desulfotomaculum sp.]
MESLIAWVFVIITLWMIFNRRRDGLSRRFPGGPVPPLPPRVPEEGDDLWVEPQREKQRYGAEPAGGDPPGGYRSCGEWEGDLPLPGPWNGGGEEADRPLPGPWN